MTFGAVYIVRFLQKRYILSLNLPKTKIAQAREIVKTVNLTFQGVRKETFLLGHSYVSNYITKEKQKQNKEKIFRF